MRLGVHWNFRLLHCTLAGIHSICILSISNCTLGLHFQGSEKELGFLAFTSDGLGLGRWYCFIS
jgi:hypothetical protein